ncbi:hypothetical protein ACLB2K_003695 [Fragaria x ananassa]
MPPPIFHRQFLDGIIDLPIHLSFPYDEMFPSQQQLIDQSSTESFRFPTFHFPKEKVLQLKAKANAEMGLRQRLKPPLPNEYFGNAFQAGITVKSTAGELLRNGIGWAALHINKMIASFTSDDARKRAENFVKSPTSPYPTDIVQTRSTPVLLIAGSSHRFNVYGNGFGWGRPLCVLDGPAGKKNGMLKVSGR